MFVVSRSLQRMFRVTHKLKLRKEAKKRLLHLHLMSACLKMFPSGKVNNLRWLWENILISCKWVTKQYSDSKKRKEKYMRVSWWDTAVCWKYPCFSKSLKLPHKLWIDFCFYEQYVFSCWNPPHLNDRHLTKTNMCHVIRHFRWRHEHCVTDCCEGSVLLSKRSTK